MAKFVYKMQNILKIKEKLESQEKIAFSLANQKLLEEQERLQQMLIRQSEYEHSMAELGTGNLNLQEIRNCRRAIDTMKDMIREQIVAVHTAQLNMENARRRMNETIKDRKTQEKLKEKAFEDFKQEIQAEEGKITDELVSYTYHNNRLEH